MRNELRRGKWLVKSLENPAHEQQTHAKDGIHGKWQPSTSPPGILLPDETVNWPDQEIEQQHEERTNEKHRKKVPLGARLPGPVGLARSPSIRKRPSSPYSRKVIP
jgi:hypothetical protein